MTQWASDQLDKIGKAEEVSIQWARRDGADRKPVTVWAVRHGDDIYVRSVKGRSGSWFRATQETRQGRIRAGAVHQDIAFAEADHGLDDEIDAAYRAKYRRYAGSILNSVLTPDARSSTLKVVPRPTGS